MKTIALIGSSGSGKSYKAIMIAKEMDIEYIIDDGLFIKGNKIIAGKSAKREGSVISAIKRAIFMDAEHRTEVIKAIDIMMPDVILILGTSDRMIDKITKTLKLPDIEKRIYIEEISSEEEIKIAQRQRRKEGKHIIPVPTFEVKKDFSGYFIDSLKIWKKKEDIRDQSYEKTVVRPTFSYLGKYTISDKVIKDLINYSARNVFGLSRLLAISLKTVEQGIMINIDIEVIHGIPIVSMIKNLQYQVIQEIDYMTSLNIISVDVNVKKMIKL
ncbi:hypothetical protein [Brassicibacter mesophilus]|jgi:uncharacterized alkaline shock family protein YloU|uniref:hypothetical protein n=1 Tax=Brassicibacter mesophilus TaxID=745119 RepID=UPI003D2106B8